MREKAVKILKGWSSDPEWLDGAVKRMADNMQICSCHACGNPRRYWDSDTMQEKRARDVDDFE